MAGAMTIRELITQYAFRANVDEVKKFDRAVDNVKSVARGAGAALTKMGLVAGAAAAGIAGLVTRVAASSDKIAKTARRLQVSSRFLQEIRHAAELSGASMSEVESGLRRVSAAAFDAARGSKEVSDSFRAVGVQVKNADGTLKSVEQITMEVFEGLANLEDTTKRAAVAQKLFGRAGQAMLPMLTGGAAGVREMMLEADRLGIVLSDKALKSAEDFNDSVTRMRAVISGTAARIATSIMPQVERLVKATQAWVAENRELISQVSAVAIEVIALAMRALADALRLAAKHWKIVMAIFAAFVGHKMLLGVIALSKAIAGVGTIMAGVAKAAFAMKAATAAAMTGGAGKAAMLTGVLGKLGGGIAALGVGWTLGSLLDDAFDLSGKLASGIWKIREAIDAPERKRRQQRFAREAGAGDLRATAQRFASLRARGVEAVQTRTGGRVALDEAGITRLLQEQARNVGLSAQALAPMLPALVRQAQMLPGATAATTAAQTTRNFQVAAPQITVNVPPGTPATQAQRVAEAAGAATRTSLRQAMGDVAR